MRLNKMYSLVSVFFALVLGCIAAAAQAPKPSAPVDPELERIKEQGKQAWQEAEQFNQAGHKDTDPNYPGRRWAATFWQYRQEHPGTVAAARATYEALHFLVHAGLFAEFEAKADSLKPDDAAWKELIGTLNEAAEYKKDNTYFINKAQWLYQQSPDKEIKVRARFMLAQTHWQKGETDKAKAGFQAVIAEFPGTPQAKRAASNLDEIAYLNTGQPAPLFAYNTTSGAPLALAELKGKVVLLEFWATWCGTCLADLPQLKELHAQYQAQGLAILGISLDEDAQALQNAIASKIIPWPQFRDGKDGPLAKLFNAQGTPTYYLLDRQGKIAAKGASIKKLSELIPSLLKTGDTAAVIEAEPRDSQMKPVEVLQSMGVRAGQVIADIGAGDGYFTRRFAAAVGPTGKAIGIEIDPAAVRAMTVDAQRRSLTNYEARLVAPDDPLLAPQSVDIIFLRDAFHHVENRTTYFSQVRAALKPHGRLVIIDFGGSGKHAIPKEAAIMTLQQAGYKLVKEHDLLLPKQFFLEFASAQ